MWPSAQQKRSKSVRQTNYRNYDDDDDDQGIAWASQQSSSRQQSRYADDNYHSNNPQRRVPAVPLANQRQSSAWAVDQFDAMPAAGKATTALGGPGGLPQGGYVDMQNTLSSLMIQKQNLENESRKVASKARNKH